MLSTNSTSSIQKRRQLHRRQQSLEVPTLDTLPANPRRTKPATQGHRRGLSLDQSLSVLNSPTGFRPLLPQDHDQDQFQGPSPVRIQLDTTNLGHQPDQQHFIKQETQQHRPAQPGYQAQDFQSHLQQQLNGNVHTNIVAPTPHNPTQEQALTALQTHLEWYQQNFGHSPSPNPIMQNNTTFAINQQIVADAQMNGVDAPQQYGVAMPQTPVSHGHPHTVPNTPQQFVRNWPSPPATDMKHARSQSFQCDVAPMHPIAFEAALPVRTSPFSQAGNNFIDHFEAAAEQAHGYQGYASSAYSSSNVDPMSPSQQYNGGPMPTLFEEEPSLGPHGHSNGLPDDAILFQAAAGASDDFNSPNFVIGGGISPHTAMMNELEDIECTIIDTGIPPEEIERHIATDTEKDGKVWYCIYELAGGKKCGKDFKRTENARSHVQNHLGDRQFLCNICGKTFVRQHDMKRHAAIHKDERPHVCPCKAKFARHDALTRHRQRGMCAGTLPGYEKTEEEKPKRGRPKKERPDQKTRTDKAKKARAMDRENDVAAVTEFNFASPSSDEHSLPMTPPDHSDFDADAFINLGNTPPTSPPPKTISPNMLTVGAMPDVPHDLAVYGSPFDSTMASSPFADDDILEMRPMGMTWGDEKGLSMFDPAVLEANSNLANVLGSWIANN